MRTLKIQTRMREELVDITPLLQDAVRSYGWTDGSALVFCAHTTCGLTINEGADPDVKRDLIRFFGEIAPREHGWEHAEGNRDAHIRSSLLGVSAFVPFEKGELRLGTWQRVYLYEGDGPRLRTLWLQWLRAEQED